MKEQNKTTLKFVAALTFAFVTVWVVVGKVGQIGASAEDNAKTWFYDQSEKRIYSISRDTLPPHKGTGGKSQDGVRAVVVTFASQQTDPSKGRVAYLETHTPELKSILEQVRQARAEKRHFEGTIPSRDSGYYETNTLIKRPDDSSWYPSNSPEALQIMSKWRAWQGPNGQPPIISSP